MAFVRFRSDLQWREPCRSLTGFPEPTQSSLWLANRGPVSTRPTARSWMGLRLAPKSHYDPCDAMATSSLTCLGCGSELLADAESCPACAVEISDRCGACEQPVHPNFVYCPACGDGIGTDERKVALASSFHRLREQMPAGLAEKVLATRGRIDGERKQVSVLFCDLVSSATIAEGMDPEEFRDLLDRYVAVVFDEVARGEGLVNQIAGDGVMALFGAPLAHEDAPVRAVQAAIAIRDGLAALSDSLRAEGRPALTARIGLNTGPVIVGTVGGDLKLDYTAIGDTTNLAARLQSLARPGAILVSESLQKLVGDRFTLRPLGRRTIRGKTLPVAVFEVEGALAAKTPLSGRASRSDLFVGRDAELAQLEAAFDRARAGTGQAVGIVGHAGVGASRLVTELVHRLDERPSTVLWAQCFSYTQRAAYRPFIDALRSHILTDDVDEAGAIAAVARALDEAGDGNTTAVPVFARLIGLTNVGTTDLEGDELRQATVDAATGYLLAKSQKAPLVLVLEDAQWIDEASKELLHALVERARDAAVLVVCTYRPDSPTPWADDDVEEIELARLTRDATAAIVRGIAGGDPPPEVVDAVHDRAEGNPFFTEEVTRELLETGVLVDAGDGTIAARSLTEIETPATVHEIVAARLDRLPLEEKRVIQVASVMGRHFSAALVEQLLSPDGIDVGARLEALRAAGVVRLSKSGAAHDFVFEQALTQEVAYQGLLIKQRRTLHNQIAAALARRYGSDPGEHSAVLAYHYRNGDSHDEALEHLLAAASHADTVPAYGTAAHLYRQAWEIARRNLEQPEMARKALFCGMRILWLAAVFGEGTEVVVEAMADEIERLLEDVGTTEDRIAVGTFQGLLRVFGAAEQHVSGLERLRSAHELAHRAKDTQWTWRVRRGLSVGYALDGRFDEAAECAQKVLEEVNAAGHGETRSDVFLWAKASHDLVLLYRDDLSPALVASKETFQLSTEAGNRTVRIMSAVEVATVLLLRGEAEEALAWAREGLNLAAAVGSRNNVPNLASIAVLAGRALGRRTDEARLLRQIENNLTGAAGIQQSLRFATWAFLAGGHLERAERVAQRVRRRAGGRLRQAQSACDLGSVALRQGESGWKRAEYFFEEAVRVAEDIGARSTLAFALMARADLLAAERQGAESEACRARAVRIAGEVGLSLWLGADGAETRQSM